MICFNSALAALPRHANLEEVEPVLTRIKGLGYTGIWVENNYLDNESLNDPVANPEFSGNWDLFNLFDLTFGRKRQQYLPYLKGLGLLCRARNLDLCLSFWVPRVSPEMLDHLAMHNPRAIGLSHAHLERDVKCLCTCSDGTGLGVLRQMIVRLFQDIPQIWGIKVATEDNHALLCDTNCPNSHGSTRAEHAGNLFSTIESAIMESNPNVRLLLYPWFWREGYKEQVFSRLKGRYMAVTKYECGSLQQIESRIPAAPLFDSSIVSGKPGPAFQAWKEIVGADRLIDMVPTGTGIDDFFLANPPYPARLFRRLEALRKAGVRSFMDFECGGHCPGTAEKVVAAFATQESPVLKKTLQDIASARSDLPTAQTHTLNGWDSFDKGFGLLPIGLGQPEQFLFSGRIGFAWSLCIATPLLPEWIGGDRKHEIHFFSPYNFFTPSSAPRLGMHFLRVLTLWQKAASELAVASALAPESDEALRDAVASEAHVLSLNSVINWSMAPGLLANTPKVFPDLMASEVEITKRFAELVDEHPWVWANHCWHPHKTPLSQRLNQGFQPEGTDAFAHKIQVMAEALSDSGSKK